MTPKEKAKELVDKFYCKTDSLGLAFCFNYSNAIQCAIIVVDEILSNFGLRAEGMTHFTTYSTIQYYQKVKQELELL